MTEQSPRTNPNITGTALVAKGFQGCLPGYVVKGAYRISGFPEKEQHRQPQDLG